MKTPLLALLLLSPIQPAALACDKTESCCTASAVASKPSSAPMAAKPAPKPVAATPAPTPRADKPHRTPGSRLPAHLFM